MERGRPAPAEEARAGAPASFPCVHCGLPMEAADPPFCCSGCQLAHRIIHEAGLERYYEQRTVYPPRPAANGGAWAGVPTRDLEDGCREARLAVDGLRCASCVWLAERAVAAMPGVASAHVSYGSGRATVRWDPAALGLSDIAERISQLGYRPRVLGEEQTPDRSLLMRLGLAVFGALNIMMIHAAIYAGWAGMDPRFTALFQWSALVLASPVACGAGPRSFGAPGGVSARAGCTWTCPSRFPSSVCISTASSPRRWEGKPIWIPWPCWWHSCSRDGCSRGVAGVGQPKRQ